MLKSTTLARIVEAGKRVACPFEPYDKLVKSIVGCELSDREILARFYEPEVFEAPLSFRHIVEVAGLEFALWCTVAAPEYAPTWRLFAVRCVRDLESILPKEAIEALDAVESFSRSVQEPWTGGWDLKEVHYPWIPSQNNATLAQQVAIEAARDVVAYRPDIAARLAASDAAYAGASLVSAPRTEDWHRAYAAIRAMQKEYFLEAVS